MDGVLYIENINMYEREQHLDPDLSWLSILKLSSIIDCSETIPTTAFLSNFNRDEANTDWTIIYNLNETMGSIRLTLIIYIIMLPFCLW